MAYDPWSPTELPIGVFHPLLNFPELVIRLDEPSGRHLRGAGDQPEDLAGGPFAGEDDMQAPEFTDVQPSRIKIAVTDCPMRLHEHKRGGTAPPEQVPAIAAGFQLPAVLEETMVALQRGGQAIVLLPQAFRTV